MYEISEMCAERASDPGEAWACKYDSAVDYLWITILFSSSPTAEQRAEMQGELLGP